MQEEEISSIEFHKILQEVEEYRKLKADIRDEAKTNLKQITKEQQKELLERGRKEIKENIFISNYKYFRYQYPSCQCLVEHEKLFSCDDFCG